MLGIVMQTNYSKVMHDVILWSLKKKKKKLMFLSLLASDRLIKVILDPVPHGQQVI